MSDYALEGPTWNGRTITWSLAGPADNSGSGAAFSGTIGAGYESTVQMAVQKWAAASGLTFQEVADATPGVDIRVGWGVFNPNSSGQIGETNYSYSYQAGSSGPEAFVPGVAVRLEDPGQLSLAPGAGGALTYQGTSTTLYQVALHELGHSLGLNHSTDPHAVLYPVAGSSNPDLDASDIAGIRALYDIAPNFSITDTTTGAQSSATGSSLNYSGPVNYLESQYVYGGADSVAIVAASPNAFLRSGSGADALRVTSGQNVLDGGEGSNFLVGGSGIDTFFIDGRGGQVTWGTIANFHPGDMVTLWGYNAGTSSLTWADEQGAAGYTGRTLHSDLNGAGTTNASITFAGASAADVARFAITTGNVGGNPYLAITDLA